MRQKSPGNGRGLYAQSEKRQEGFKENHLRNRKGEKHDNDAEYVWHKVAKDNPRPSSADRPGRFDKLLVLERNDLAAHDTGHREPINRPDDEEKNRDPIDAVAFQPGFNGVLTEYC